MTRIRNAIAFSLFIAAVAQVAALAQPKPSPNPQPHSKPEKDSGFELVEIWEDGAKVPVLGAREIAADKLHRLENRDPNQPSAISGIIVDRAENRVSFRANGKLVNLTIRKGKGSRGRPIPDSQASLKREEILDGHSQTNAMAEAMLMELTAQTLLKEKRPSSASRGE